MLRTPFQLSSIRKKILVGLLETWRWDRYFVPKRP